MMMKSSRSLSLFILVALSVSTAGAFTTHFRRFTRKFSLATLPDSLDIPDFQSTAAASPSVEAIVEKISTSAPSISTVAQPAVVASVSASVSVPASDVSTVADLFPSELLPIGLAAVALAVVGTFLMSGNGEQSSTPEPPTATSASAPTPGAVSTSPVVDLSIPYDAAARLEYGKGDEAGFAKFKQEYVARTVKMVIEKKKARGTGY